MSESITFDPNDTKGELEETTVVRDETTDTVTTTYPDGSSETVSTAVYIGEDL